MNNNTSYCSDSGNSLYHVCIKKNRQSYSKTPFSIDFDSELKGTLSFCLDFGFSFFCSMDGDASVESLLYYKDVVDKICSRLTDDRSGSFEENSLSVSSEFLECVKSFLNRILDKKLVFHPNSKGFWRLSEYLSLYSFIVYKLESISDCFEEFPVEEYPYISLSLPANYFDLVVFRCCLYHNLNGKVFKYCVKIRSLDDFKIKCSKLIESL